MKTNTAVLIKKVSRFFALLVLSFALSFAFVSLQFVKISCSETKYIQYKNEISLSWEEVQKAKGYDFEICDGDTCFMRKQTTKNNTALDLKPGIYRFRIRSLASDRLKGPWSEFKTFTLKPNPPVLKNPIFYKNPKSEDQTLIELHWIEPQLADYYLIRIWKDEKVLSDEKTERKNNFKIEAADSGRYRFAIATIYKDLTGPFSKQKELVIAARKIASVSEENFRKGDAFQETLALSPSLGVTALSYKETLEDHYSSLMLTGKIGADYRFSKKWDAAANAYFTFIPISSSNKNATIRFLGLNLRLGYQISLSKTTYLDIMPGWYFTTTFTTNNAFGFKNMTGPQIFPVLKYKIGSKINGYNYFKYSPIMDGFGMPTFKSKEIAAGFGIIIGSFIRPGMPMIISVDYANLDINFENMIYIKSNAFSFGLGTNF